MARRKRTGYRGHLPPDFMQRHRTRLCLLYEPQKMSTKPEQRRFRLTTRELSIDCDRSAMELQGGDETGLHVYKARVITVDDSDEASALSLAIGGDAIRHVLDTSGIAVTNVFVPSRYECHESS